MPPTPPPVELVPLIAAVLLNPAMIVVAALMGRRADQPAKLIIAGFTAALAGTVLLAFAMLVGVPGLEGLRRQAAGILALQVFAGTAIAGLVNRLGRG